MGSSAQRLKWEREQRSWSQEQVAEMIGTTAPNVSRWERGLTRPSPHFRQKLIELFGKTVEELGFIQDADDGSLQDERNSQLPEIHSFDTSPPWYVPYRRNPFFTGREEVLQTLHRTLQTNTAAVLTQVQAISGLGGIGKTATAVEYAYRYRDEYEAILWLHAETRDTLIADIISIARLLHLFEQEDQDQLRIVETFKYWLNTHKHWLLILDNVEDLPLVEDILPTQSACHVLLTTRSQSTGGVAQRIDLEGMALEEGILFLLRRAELIADDASLEQVSEEKRTIAREITLLMDGFPLALDQAGAYIEETACSLSDYLDHYQNQHTTLLALRGGVNATHPHSVYTTFSLSFEKIEQANPASADLLRLCAFLYPDGIPEEILTEGACELGPTLQPVAQDPFKLNMAFAPLRKYSLLHRDPETRMLSIHRLVQMVLKDRMAKDEQHVWAERAVRGVNRTFPDVNDNMHFSMWRRCQRCLPHAQVCIGHIEQWDMAFLEAGRILAQIGNYLNEYDQPDEAEAPMKKSLDILLPIWGPEHPEVAKTLYNLGEIRLFRGPYAQAEATLQQSLAIFEKVLGSSNSDVAMCLNDLGILYHIQGRFTQSELSYKRALDIGKQATEQEIPTFIILNNFACLYLYQGKYALAEPMFIQALETYEQVVGQGHPRLAYVINNLARLYRDMGQYIRSERLFEQALSLREQTLGLEHRMVAQTLDDWSRLRYLQGKYAEGESFSHRALAIWKRVYGEWHPQSAQTCNNLAMFSLAQGRYTQAEAFAQQALSVREQTIGLEHPKVAQTLNVLANIYRSQAKYEQAQPLCQRALKIYKQSLGPENHRAAQVLDTLTMLELAQNRYTQAEDYCRSALSTREKILGEKHPDVAQSLDHLALACYYQGQFEKAEHYYQQALSIQEQVLEREHIDRATTLEHYALLLSSVGRASDASLPMKQAKEIRENLAKQNML